MLCGCRGQMASSTPGSERSPGVENGNPLHIFAWKILWTEEPEGLQFVESQLGPLDALKKDSRSLSRGAAGNPRVPRLLLGTLGNLPGCL